METVIQSYQKLKYLTEDIEESTNDRLREYTEELTVPPNSLPTTSAKKERTLNRQSTATSSSTSIHSGKSERVGATTPGVGGSTSLTLSNVIEQPTIPEVDHDSEEDEDTNAMFINDKFHLRNQSLFVDHANTSKELMDLLTRLSTEEIQPLVDEIVTSTIHLDEQRQETMYEESYDFFLSLIDKLKQSSTQRVDQLSHSLQLLLNRQREIFDITIEKYKQDYGYYRMKNRQVELQNQIQKLTLKLQDIRYELSMRQEEFNSSAEDLRSHYEQELETMIRTLLQTIEEKQKEHASLTAKHTSIQQDIQRICNELSQILHELEREEKAKAYQSIYGTNKKFIDHRSAPIPIPEITTEKIEEVFNQSRIVDPASIQGTNSNNKPANLKGRRGQTLVNTKSNKVLNNLQRASGIAFTDNLSYPNLSERGSPNLEEGERGGGLRDVRDEKNGEGEDDYDPNQIFEIFPFLNSHEISEEMVSESVKITDALLLEVEGKRKELQEQEEKIQEAKQKIQNLLKSEENKALERLKMMVNNMENKIDSDGKRVDLLQALVQNLTSETKGDGHSQRYKSVRSTVNKRESRVSKVRESSSSNLTEEVTADQPFDESKQEEEEDLVNYDNLSEVEINVLKYQQLMDKGHAILQREREKVQSRERSLRQNRQKSKKSSSSHRIAATVASRKPFSSLNSEPDNNITTTQGGPSQLRTQEEEEEAGEDPTSEIRVNIKRMITPQQVAKIQRILEMFAYYGNLTEHSEIDRVHNTLLPYSNLPLGWKLPPLATDKTTEKASRAESRKDSQTPGGVLGMEGKEGSKSKPAVSTASTSPNKTRAKQTTFLLFDDTDDPTGLKEIESLSNTTGAGGRRSALSPVRSTLMKSRATESLASQITPAGFRGIKSLTDNNNKQKAKERGEGGRGFPYYLEAQEKEQQQFFTQNYGYKAAVEQIATIYNILLKWNHPSRSDQLTASTIINNAIILQTDNEANELLTIEVLKSQLQTLLLKCKTLYKQNTYYNSIVKELSKGLVQELQTNQRLQQELLQEISSIKWNANSLPGQYQVEMDTIKERLVELKKESKIWEKKVAKRRVTNIRLSQLLSDNSKNVRKALPVRNSFQMVQAILQQENPVTSENNNQAKPQNPTLFGSQTLSHGANPVERVPAFLQQSAPANDSHRKTVTIDMTLSGLRAEMQKEEDETNR